MVHIVMLFPDCIMSLVYNIDSFMLYAWFLKTFECLDCTCHLPATIQTIMTNTMLTKEVCGERNVKRTTTETFFGSAFSSCFLCTDNYKG